MRHMHELETGATSSISQQVLGFDGACRLLSCEQRLFTPPAVNRCSALTAPAGCSTGRRSCEQRLFTPLAVNRRLAPAQLDGGAGAHDVGAVRLLVAGDDAARSLRRRQLLINYSLTINQLLINY